MPTVIHIIDQNLPVYATGNQTITGVKEFRNRPTVNGTGILLSGEVPGPIGATGPRGATGPQGFVGSTGPQGFVGSTGPQGFVGSTGPQGFVGATGPRGATGPQGFVGATGPQGFVGATGPQGFVGSTGPQGLLDGDQTINGVKNFTSRPTVNNSQVLLNGEAPLTLVYSLSGPGVLTTGASPSSEIKMPITVNLPSNVRYININTQQVLTPNYDIRIVDTAAMSSANFNVTHQTSIINPSTGSFSFNAWTFVGQGGQLNAFPGIWSGAHINPNQNLKLYVTVSPP